MTVVVGFTILLATLVDAQIEMEFSPNLINLNTGEKALVEVSVRNVPSTGLVAFQFTVSYTTESIEIMDPNQAAGDQVDSFVPLGNHPSCAEVTSALQRNACDDPDWLITNTGREAQLVQSVINNEDGIVQIAYGTTPPTIQAPSGNGVIAQIEIIGSGEGTTDIEFTNVVFASPELTPIPFTTSSLTVDVNDGILPSITCPTDITAASTSNSGTVVAYPTPTVIGATASCEPPSGSQFPIGKTEVECTAMDDGGNMDGCTFNVVVQTSELEFILSAGWNLISIPFGDQPIPVDSVLTGPGSDTLEKKTVWRWNGKRFVVAKEFIQGWGYWIFNRGSLPVTIINNGHLTESRARSGHPGWNLVGPVDYLAVTAPKNIEIQGKIWGWSNNAKSLFPIDSETLPEMLQGKIIPNAGYWIFLTEGANLILGLTP